MARSFWPREHGAYAEAGFPLVNGLALGRPDGPVPWLLALSVVAAFLAHEPWEVLRGGRGERVRREHRSRARRRLILLLAIAAAAGGVAVLVADVEVRRLLLWPVGFAMVVGGGAIRGRSKSLGGELLSVAAFASVIPALARSGGAAAADAWAASLVWLVVFGTGTVAVHAIKGDARSPRRWRRPAAAGGAVLLLTALITAWRAGAIAGHVPLAVSGTVALLVGVVVADVRPRRLREVGWTLAALCGAALAVVLIGAR